MRENWSRYILMIDWLSALIFSLEPIIWPSIGNSNTQWHMDHICEREEATKFQSKQRLKLTCHRTLHELSSCLTRARTQSTQKEHIPCAQPKWTESQVKFKSTLNSVKQVTGILKHDNFHVWMSLLHRTTLLTCSGNSIEIHLMYIQNISTFVPLHWEKHAR